MGLAQGWRKRQIENQLDEVIKEAIMQERKACADLMMRLHEERKHVHNYYHFAANEIMDREIP